MELPVNSQLSREDTNNHLWYKGIDLEIKYFPGSEEGIPDFDYVKEIFLDNCILKSCVIVGLADVRPGVVKRGHPRQKEQHLQKHS